MMTRKMLLRLLVAAAMALPAYAARAQDALQSVYEAAKKEGKLVYWGSPDPGTAGKLRAAFNAKYPGIEVEVFKIQPAPAIERVIADTSANRASVDVMDSQLAYFDLLFDRKLVVNHSWTGPFAVEPSRILFEGRGLALWHLDTPMVVNTQLVKPGDIKAWEDLLDPKYRRKLIIEARGFAFAILALKWGEEKAFNYLKSLMAMNPIISKGGTATVEALAGGQGSVAVGAYGGNVELTKASGAPIDWLRVGPVPAAYGALLQLSNAPHPNAARLWMHFMMSKEANAAIYAGMGLDVVAGQSVGPLGEKYRAGGIEIVLESPDTNKMKALVGQAAKLIGSL